MHSFGIFTSRLSLERVMDIDSELTRAELCFRNGEYTQALTVALATIERIHPGSYEKLIKENAQSAA